MSATWIDRLERRFEGWHMPQLATFIVAMNAAIYVLSLVKPEFPILLTLQPDLIGQGQLWRLFTFLFIPPSVSPLWMFFWLYLLYTYAQALENEWGDFRFNLFYGLGALSTIAASLLLGAGLSNFILNTTIFLAFAALYPDFELMLFFVLPVKVKWLAYIWWLVMAFNFLGGGWYARTAIAAGLLNYGLFFGRTHWENVKFWLQVRRNRRRYRQAFKDRDDEDA